MNLTKKTGAILLDRDGTMIEEVHFLSRPDQVRLIHGAGKALRDLSDAGFHLIVITNQSGIARGYFTEEDLVEIHKELTRQLGNWGVTLDAIYHCPNHKDGVISKYASESPRRKPGSGMIEECLRDFPGIAPSMSWMIGDSARDLSCVSPWPIRRILVRTGHGEKTLASTELKAVPPHFIASDLNQAAEHILNQKAHCP